MNDHHSEVDGNHEVWNDIIKELHKDGEQTEISKDEFFEYMRKMIKGEAVRVS